MFLDITRPQTQYVPQELCNKLCNKISTVNIYIIYNQAHTYYLYNDDEDNAGILTILWDNSVLQFWSVVVKTCIWCKYNGSKDFLVFNEIFAHKHTAIDNTSVSLFQQTHNHILIHHSLFQQPPWTLGQQPTRSSDHKQSYPKLMLTINKIPVIPINGLMFCCASSSWD